jgi:hypothetical protein
MANCNCQQYVEPMCGNICDDPECNHPKNQHVLVGILDQNGLLQMIAQPVNQIDSTPLKNQGSYSEKNPSMNCFSSRYSSSKGDSYFIGTPAMGAEKNSSSSIKRTDQMDGYKLELRNSFRKTTQAQPFSHKKTSLWYL